MAKRQPKYFVSGIGFTSKKSLIDYVRTKIHSRYADNEPLRADDMAFMIDLLRMHPWAEQKIGAGILNIWIAPDNIYGTRCFWLRRIDGTCTDFSFYQCVQSASLTRDFRSACRAAIANIVIEFKIQQFEANALVLCEISGQQLSFDSCHVDHCPPNTFERIVSQFISDRQIDISNVEYEAHADGDIGCNFKDERFRSEWIEFHNRLAVLRILDATAHLSQKRPV